MNVLQRWFLAAAAAVQVQNCASNDPLPEAPPTLDTIVIVDSHHHWPDTSQKVPEIRFYNEDSTPENSKYCDDGSPARTWLIDKDGDGYFAKVGVSCQPPDNIHSYITAEQLQEKTGREIPLLDCEGYDTNSAIYPYAEDVCDGLDNDCDLLIDEDEPSIAKPCNGGTFTTCEGLQFRYCLDGKLSEWSECVDVIVKEYCDGMDNDCNGIVDDISPEVCTTPCGAGTEICLEGKVACDYEITDPNCCEPVGAIKDQQLCSPTQYVFVIDASASTYEATSAVRDALVQFADAHELENIAGELGMIVFRENVEEYPHGIALNEEVFKQWAKDYDNISSMEGHLNALMHAATDFPWPAEGKYHAILISDSHFDVAGDFDSFISYTTEQVRTALSEKGVYLSAVQVYSSPFDYYPIYQYEELTQGIGQHLLAPDADSVASVILSLLEPNTFSWYVCDEDNLWKYVSECEENTVKDTESKE
ncbi:hypothetical protein HY496_01250 [Candidatus Woesearchaeota archaeon]|nr:hypothetical protein [Candidatus Woesearchaeota archaeon]